MNRSKAGGDLVLLQALVLFMSKSWYSHANKSLNMIIYILTTMSVTKQGHCKPSFHSKARALSTQL